MQPGIDCVVVPSLKVLEGVGVDCLGEPCVAIVGSRGEGDTDAEVGAETVVEAGALAESTPDRFDVEEGEAFGVGFDVASVFGLAAFVLLCFACSESRDWGESSSC
ncbi:hypothetical protein DL98DRAFT_517051 [Cadophora sp. DSE1049]|nr:hypothetical protein DL98DRAFT_517051 [Cadophora sp. DSE1049]